MEIVRKGPHGTVPYLLVGTGIPTTESLVVHVLEASGGTSPRPPGQISGADLNVVLARENRMADVARPTDRRETALSRFQMTPGSSSCFGVVPARTEAATLMAFTEGGKPTAQYLSKEEGRRHFQHDASVSTAGRRLAADGNLTTSVGVQKYLRPLRGSPTPARSGHRRCSGRRPCRPTVR